MGEAEQEKRQDLRIVNRVLHQRLVAVSETALRGRVDRLHCKYRRSAVLPFLVACKNFIRVNITFFYPGAWVFSQSQAFRRRISLQATPKGIGMGSPELSRLRNYVRPVAG